jgi:hypothetical protein
MSRTTRTPSLRDAISHERRQRERDAPSPEVRVAMLTRFPVYDSTERSECLPRVASEKRRNSECSRGFSGRACAWSWDRETILLATTALAGYFAMRALTGKGPAPIAPSTPEPAEVPEVTRRFLMTIVLPVWLGAVSRIGSVIGRHRSRQR